MSAHPAPAGAARPSNSTMRNSAPDLTLLVRNLVRYAGRHPQGFEASVLQDGSIRVLGPFGAVFYPAEAWTSRFMRHLHKGYFEAAVVARRVAQAA